MTESMEAYLRLAEPHLRPALVSEGALADLRRLCALLPPVRGFGFECPLGLPLARADFGMRLLPEDDCAGALEARAPGEVELPALLRDHPVWERLAAFSRAWLAPGSALREGIQDIFFEFDQVHGAPGTPVPFFFFQFRPGAGRRVAVTDAALELLLGGPMPPGLRRCVERCFERLPAHARIFSVGIMFSRGLEAIRLCVHGLRPDQWLGCLSDLGWPGPLADVAAAVQGLPELADRVALAIDVADAIAPKIGVELQVNDGIRRSRARWERLLGWLVDAGHCLPEKRDAALSWIGYSSEREQQAPWPAGLRASRIMNGRALGVLTRRISHVKAVHRPGRSLEAKIYLEIMHHTVRFDEARRTYVMDAGVRPSAGGQP